MEPINPDKTSPKTVKPAVSPIPLPVVRGIKKLGADLSLARRRRHMTQASLAERIGASLSTVQRMEKGDVRVPVRFIASAMFIFGEVDAFTNLMDTSRDDIGLLMMDEQLPQRVRNKKNSNPGAR